MKTAQNLRNQMVNLVAAAVLASFAGTPATWAKEPSGHPATTGAKPATKKGPKKAAQTTPTNSCFYIGEDGSGRCCADGPPAAAVCGGSRKDDCCAAPAKFELVGSCRPKPGYWPNSNALMFPGVTKITPATLGVKFNKYQCTGPDAAKAYRAKSDEAHYPYIKSVPTSRTKRVNVNGKFVTRKVPGHKYVKMTRKTSDKSFYQINDSESRFYFAKLPPKSPVKPTPPTDPVINDGPLECEWAELIPNTSGGVTLGFKPDLSAKAARDLAQFNMPNACAPTSGSKDSLCFGRGHCRVVPGKSWVTDGHTYTSADKDLNVDMGCLKENCHPLAGRPSNDASLCGNDPKVTIDAIADPAVNPPVDPPVNPPVDPGHKGGKGGKGGSGV